MVIPAVIGGIGSLIAGGLNYAGATQQNVASKKLAREQMRFQQGSTREQMAFQKESIGEQMQFQERMSNTAYQRAVQDMAAAGLNPMLAYMQGGASTPSGSSASGASASGAQAPVVNRMAAAIASAQQARMVDANVGNIKALTELAKAELPGKQAEAKIWSSKVGPYLKVMQLLSQPATAVAKYIR